MLQLIDFFSEPAPVEHFAKNAPLMMFTVCLQAYTEELVDLHRRLMALRERNVLQQVRVLAPARFCLNKKKDRPNIFHFKCLLSLMEASTYLGDDGRMATDADDLL